MRFWITKNGEVPVHEQIVRQVMLGIMSEDLPAGYKLPSVRAFARRHRVHANTVSAAYHQLLSNGWLELRRGSGLFVRPMRNVGDDPLDRIAAGALDAARAHGFRSEEILRRIERLIQSRSRTAILVAEPEPAMRAILVEELREQSPVPVREFAASAPPGSVVVGLANQIAGIPGAIPLQIRSIPSLLEGQPRPAATSVVAVASRSARFRHSSRAVLIAVGLDPASILEVDAGAEDWRDRIALSSLVIADLLAARDLTADPRVRIYRVISDQSVCELTAL